MKTKEILIITHGNLGKELLNSVEMIMGEQKNVTTLALNLGDSIESLREEAIKIVRENQNLDKETIILVDMLGGSPSNIALYILKVYDIKLITGINIPMLIELLSSKDYKDMEDLVEDGFQTGIEGIKKFDSKLLN